MTISSFAEVWKELISDLNEKSLLLKSVVLSKRKVNLVGGFEYFLFSPLFGENYHFDYYFSNGLKPPTS